MIASASCGSCASCRFRSRLLAELAGPLDACARDWRRLLDALALDADALLALLGGRRRAELEAARAQLGGERPPAGVVAMCAHRADYPVRLRPPRGPWLVHCAGSPGRLLRLAAGDVVAIAGSVRASDYGAEVARALARELGACGVTIAATLERGIAAAARLGVAEAAGSAIAVCCDGLPSPRRPPDDGCVVAELPCGARGRSFGAPAAQRTLAALATVVVVVESAESPRALLAAHHAAACGATVAAVPGPITARGSSGSHALLRAGAVLVRGTEDVLDLLAGIGDRRRAAQPAPASARLAPRLTDTLERIAGGADTAARLCSGMSEPDEILLALAELELLGLVGRGFAGRYVARAGAAWQARQSSSAAPTVQAPPGPGRRTS